MTIHFLVGNPVQLYAEQRNEKLTLMTREGRDACSAAFGSSHIHNGFDPRIFDRVMHSHAADTITLNLAIEGGSQTEQYVMAEKFIASRPDRDDDGKNCVVLLEINAGTNFANRDLTHPRAINIYDTDVASLGLEFSTAGLSMSRKAGRAAFVMAAMAMHYLNVGMLGNRLLPHAENEQLYRRQSADDRRGFLTEPPIATDDAAVERMFRLKPENPTSVPATLTKGNADLILRLMRQSRPNRLRFVYIVSPKLEDLEQFETYPPCIQVGSSQARIINVAQPTLYPTLYQRALWHDPTHLNEAGAAEYTRLVAEALETDEAVDAGARTCARV